MLKDKRTAMVGTLVVVLFLSLLTLMAPGKASAVSGFLKVDGIPGESTDDKHKDWIDIVSWSYGETQSAEVTASKVGGAAAERVKMQNFKFTMRTNKASPKLFQTCASGQHIREVVLEVCKSGGDKSKFLEVKLSEVIVSSFVSLGSSVTAGADAYPMEEILLSFSKIKITYTMQKRADGSGGGNVEGGWDVKANKAY